MKLTTQEYQRRYHLKHRARHLKKAKERANAKPVEEKRAYHRARTYGIHDIEALLDYYAYFCPLCSKPVTSADCVDHDHITGKVRGVLCGTCNTTLGVLENGKPVRKQTEDWLERARHYQKYNYGTNNPSRRSK